MASIVVKINEDGEVVKAQLGIEMGTTCYEGAAPADETDVGLATGDVLNWQSKAPNDTAGAFGLPDGFSPGDYSGDSDCPGFY